MGRPVNVFKVISSTNGKINSEYNLTVDQASAIRNKCKCDCFKMICYAFVFGYAQGVKAQKKGRAYNAKNTINK